MFLLLLTFELLCDHRLGCIVVHASESCFHLLIVIFEFSIRRVCGFAFNFSFKQFFCGEKTFFRCFSFQQFFNDCLFMSSHVVFFNLTELMQAALLHRDTFSIPLLLSIESFLC